MDKASPPRTPPPGAERPPSIIADAQQSEPKTEPDGRLKNIQKHMVIYGNTLYETTTNSLLNPFKDPSISSQPIHLPEHSPEELNLAAENVARALEDLANAHPSSQAQEEYRRKAKNFRRLSQLPTTGPKPRSTLNELMRGLMLLLLAPVALVGMILYVVGVMLEGTGSMLKSVGYHGKKLFRVDRRREWPLRDREGACANV